MTNSSDVHVAVETHACDDLKVLLKYPANQESLSSYNEQGHTPLLLAVNRGYEDIVEILLSHGASPDQSNRDGITPLHIALRQGLEKTVNMLTEAGAKFDIRDDMGATPLHLAVERGRFDIFEKFFNDQNFHDKMKIVEAKDNSGRTIFHCAAQFFNPSDPTNPHLKIVKKLCELGLPIDVRANFGYTPLHYACRIGNLAMVRYLIENGADYGLETDNGEDPLAISGSNKELCDYIQQQLTKKPKGRWALITDDAKRSRAIEATRLLKGEHSIEEAQAIYLVALREANACDDSLAQVFYINAIGHCHLWRALCQDVGKKENNKAALNASNKNNSSTFLNPHVMHGYCNHFTNAAIYFNAAYQLWRNIDSIAPSIDSSQVEISLKYSVGLVDLHFTLQMERRGLIKPQFDRKTIPELPKFALQENLKSMREALMSQLNTAAPSSNQANFQTLDQVYDKLWTGLVEQTQSLMGAPPSNDYVIMAIGEYAQGNVFPYSRLKWAVLINHSSPKKEALKKYFYAFSWMLSIKTVQLGETPCCVLQGGESPTISGIHIHPSENPQGIPEIYELLGTPNELAHLQTRYQDSVMQKLLQDLQHVRFLTGDKTLFEDYIKALKSELSNTYPHPYHMEQATAKQKVVDWRLLKIQGLYQLTQALDDFDRMTNREALTRFSTSFYEPLINALWGFLRLKSTKFKYDASLIEQLENYFAHDLTHGKALKSLKESIQKLHFLRLKIQIENQDGLEFMQFSDESRSVAANNVYHLGEVDYQCFKEIYQSFVPIMATLKQIVMESNSTLRLFSHTDHVSTDVILYSILQSYDKAINEAKEQIANNKKTQMLATKLYLSRLYNQTKEPNEAITVLETLMNHKSFKKLGRLKQAEVYFRLSVAYRYNRNYNEAQKVAKQGVDLLIEKGIGPKHPLRLVLLSYTHSLPRIGLSRIQKSQDTPNQSTNPSPILSPRNASITVRRVNKVMISNSSLSRPQHQQSSSGWDKIPTNPFILKILMENNAIKERLSDVEVNTDMMRTLLEELDCRVSVLEDTTAQIRQQIELISEKRFNSMIDELNTTDQTWLNDLNLVTFSKTSSNPERYFELYLRKTINEYFLKCSLIARGLVNRKEGKLETALGLAKDLISFIPFTMIPTITSMIMQAGLALYDHYETERIKRFANVSENIDGLSLMVASVSKRYTQIYQEQLQKLDQNNMEIFAKGIMKLMCKCMVKMKLHERIKKVHGFEETDHSERYPVLETLSVCAMMPGMHITGGPLKKKTKLKAADGKSNWSVEGLLQYSGLEVIHSGSREKYKHAIEKYNHIDPYGFRKLQSTEYHIFCRLLQHLPKATRELPHHWIPHSTFSSSNVEENKVTTSLSSTSDTNTQTCPTNQPVATATTKSVSTASTMWQPDVFKQSKIEQKQTIESPPDVHKEGEKTTMTTSNNDSMESTGMAASSTSISPQ